MNTNTAQSIDTGDTVHHAPTGEEWLVAYVANELLCACGWPCTLVPVSECTMKVKASPEQRQALLQRLADGQGDDPRRSHARRVLATQAPTTSVETVLCPNGEPWDDNPDGIIPGQDRGPRMNSDTGLHEGGEADEDTPGTPEATGSAATGTKEAAVIAAAHEWAAERTINDWTEADLMKAIASLDGDWGGCPDCNHEECDEPCVPHTVADVHAAIDSRIAQLVHEGKLLAYVGYAPPAGWKPIAMPAPRRRRNPVNDELTTSFCDTLDGTRWRRLIAFRDVSAERNRQDEQWGGPAHDDTHSIIDWQNCIHKQIRQLANKAERRERLVKIAALAIAAIESHDRIKESSKGGAV